MVSSFFEGEALAPFSKSSWLSTQVGPSVKETTIHISHWQSQRSRRRISSLRDRKEIKTRRLSEFSLVRAGLNQVTTMQSKEVRLRNTSCHTRSICMYTREGSSLEFH